jgi:hypothetical protein
MGCQEEIKEIQAEILKEAGGRIAKDLGRSLSIISGMVFVRTARFIMELIQNAEDALIDAEYPGEMEIVVSDKRVKVTHNGKPFTREDVDAICGVRSTKKPERGTLGYMGIGFKSVFKITDSPQIFSGCYAFKFDKNYWREENYRALWPIIPIPISLENITETVPTNKTTFILPFRSRECYDAVKDEVKRLGPHLFMFLKKLSKLTILDEVTGERKVFEWYIRQTEKLSPNLEVKKIHVVEDGKLRRFLVFSGVFAVPDKVKMDRFTQEAKRGGVVAREVSIAFPLDEKEERLVNIEEVGWVYGGLYSFLPLEEAVSGAPFLIQGDFIVQPGREAINYEAEWNKWMMECVGEIATKAIEYFWKNPKFCGQYIPFFQIKPGYGDFYTKLIEPYLKRKIEEKLRDSYVPAVDGTIVPLSKAVKITEEVEVFIQKGLLRKEDLNTIFKEDGLNFIGKDVNTGTLNIKKLTLKNLHNRELIEKKLKEGVGLDFLIELYREADKGNLYSIADYYDSRFCWYVIDRELNITYTNITYFSSLPKEVEELLEGVPSAKEVLGEYKFVHPKLEASIKDPLEKAGVKRVSYKEICEKVVIPRVSIHSPKPTTDDAKNQLKAWTYMLKKGGIYPDDEIWVLDRNGEARSSVELFLPLEGKNKLEEYEKAGIRFVDLDAYVSVDREQDREKAKQEWIYFFNRLKIRSPKEDRRSIEIVLRKVGKDAPKLNKEDLITCTKILKELSETFPDVELPPIQVLTDKEEIEISENVYFSSKYEPEQDWQKQNLVKVGSFISDKYLEEGDVKGWREFFRKVKVREKAPSEIVENYAIEYVKNKLQEQGYSDVRPSHNGHDLICSKDEVEYYIEVKGRTTDIDNIKLEKSEVKTAIKKKNNYILAVVFGIPNQPKLCKVINPVEAVEDWYEITIPKETLEKFCS